MEKLVLLFFATFVAAIIGSAPPGLLNVNAAKTSVDKGKKQGLAFSLGITVMVMLQVYIAVRIAKFLSRNTDIVAWLMKVAVVIFAILAVFFFIKASKDLQEQVVLRKTSSKNNFTKGSLLAALNLLQVPFYSTLNAFFHQHQMMRYRVLDEVVFILGAGLGTFLVMYTYVVFIKKIMNKTKQFSKNANYILSALMIVLLIITLIRITNG